MNIGGLFLELFQSYSVIFTQKEPSLLCNLPKNLPKGFQEFPSFSEIFQLFSNVFPIQKKQGKRAIISNSY